MSWYKTYVLNLVIVTEKDMKIKSIVLAGVMSLVFSVHASEKQYKKVTQYLSGDTQQLFQGCVMNFSEKLNQLR